PGGMLGASPPLGAGAAPVIDAVAPATLEPGPGGLPPLPPLPPLPNFGPSAPLTLPLPPEAAESHSDDPPPTAPPPPASPALWLDRPAPHGPPPPLVVALPSPNLPSVGAYDLKTPQRKQVLLIGCGVIALGVVIGVIGAFSSHGSGTSAHPIGATSAG